jgi:hypothetical protein
MLRTAAPLVCVALFIAAAQDPASEEKDGFGSLIKESDLSDWEGNTTAGWTLENGILRGRADGRSPAFLMLKDRNPGDFELRFEALVHRGAVRVKMRGPGPGPLGIAVEINSGEVELVTNGMPFFTAASNRPDEWNEYRVLLRGSNLKVWKNRIPAPYDMVASHMNETGRLSLHLSDHEASDVSLRRLRIKE